MAEGTRFGRTPKLTKHQAREASKRVAAGETLREIALSYNVDLQAQGPLRCRDILTPGGLVFSGRDASPVEVGARQAFMR
jgi:hypothetical protein